VSRHGRLLGVAIAALLGLAPTAQAAPENEAPRCFDATVAVIEDRSRPLTLPCFDDGGPQQPTYTFGTPAHGDLVRGAMGGWRYVPDPGFDGEDSVTFTVSDGEASSVPKTLTLKVTTANLAPQCFPGRLRAVAGNGYLPSNACLDPNEGDAVRISAVDPPDHGTTNDNGSSLSYSATQGYTGPDTFTLRASDGFLTSATAEVAVTVEALTAPGCVAGATTPVRTGTPKTLALSCRDNTGFPSMTFGFSVVTEPAHGDLIPQMGGMRYQPDPGYRGSDQGTIKVSNAAGQSEPLVVRFNVADNANEPPRCYEPMARVTRADRTIQVGLGCSDPDGDALTVQVLDDVDHGALSFSGMGGTYTSDAAHSGDDAFTARVSDGHGGTSNAVTQPIRVVGQNENTAPSCFPTGSRVRQGEQTGVPLHCIDEEGDAITSHAVTAPQHGTVGPIQEQGGFGPWVSYTAPASPFTGLDRFTFTATDDRGGTSVPTAALLDVRAPAPLECASLADRGVRTNHPLYVSVWCSTDQGPTGTQTIEVEPEHGTLTNHGYGSYTYQPDEDFQGPDSFTIRATQGEQTDTVTQDVTISDAYNTKPGCSGDYNASTREAPVELDLGCHDWEHDPITISVVDGPDHGTLGAFDASRVTYTPDPGFTGTDRFTVRPNDGREDGPAYEQVVTVRPLASNQRPVCQSFTTFTDVGKQAVASPWCHDGDGDPLTMTITDPPDDGTVVWDPAWSAWRYTPPAGFEGWATFTFTASDGREASTPATITVQVGQPAARPTCFDVAANVVAGEARRLQLPCSVSPFGGVSSSLRYEIVEAPAYGTLGAVEPTGHVTYTPDAAYSGEDTFRYRAFNGDTPSQPATARLGVGVRLSAGGGGDATVGGGTTGDGQGDPAPPPPPEPPPLAPNDPFARLGGRVVPAPGVTLGSARAFVGAGTPARGLRLDRRGGVDVMAILCSTACTVLADPALELRGAKAASRGGGLKLRRQRLVLPVGRPGLIAVKLPSALRKRVRRARSARLRVTITVRDARGKVARDTARFRLRAR